MRPTEVLGTIFSAINSLNSRTSPLSPGAFESGVQEKPLREVEGAVAAATGPVGRPRVPRGRPRSRVLPRAGRAFFGPRAGHGRRGSPGQLPSQVSLQSKKNDTVLYCTSYCICIVLKKNDTVLCCIVFVLYCIVSYFE